MGEEKCKTTANGKGGRVQTKCLAKMTMRCTITQSIAPLLRSRYPLLRHSLHPAARGLVTGKHRACKLTTRNLANDKRRAGRRVFFPTGTLAVPARGCLDVGAAAARTSPARGSPDAAAAAERTPPARGSPDAGAAAACASPLVSVPAPGRPPLILRAGALASPCPIVLQ